MKEEKYSKERVFLVEKELATLADRLDKTEAALNDIKDLLLEMKGLKLFFGRVHPEFKKQFPEIMRKIKG